MRKNRLSYDKRGGVYVHIPFCHRKCIYCDFYSVGDRLADWSTYIGAILKELEDRANELDELTVISLYIGGGTPSLIPEPNFIQLCQGINSVLRKKNIAISEFTIEINPDDVCESKARSWKEAGVNRVSMGIQSLVDPELKIIGRRHDSKCALNAYSILRNVFDNISLDVMFGLPEQTLESLEETIDGIIKMYPQHISAYSLMYEERTAITSMRAKGVIKESPEDVSVEMFRFINRKLSDAGYERYEFSNYALPGFYSEHNSGYWNNMPYIGLGAGAHSYDGKNIRKWNQPSIKLYQTYWNGDHSVEIADKEQLSEDEVREEMIMTRLRTSKGLNLTEFKKRFGNASCNRLTEDAKKFIKAGLLEFDGDFLRFTEDGVMVSDEVISEIF